MNQPFITTDCFIGEIRTFAGTTPPSGWVICDGSLLTIAGNPMLYALIGTTYGGDGAKTFAIPDLRGRIPIHRGKSGAMGATDHPLGSSGGSEAVTVSLAEMPTHSHGVQATTAAGDQFSPANAVFAAASQDGKTLSADVTAYAPLSRTAQPVSLDPRTVSAAGGATPRNNMMPTLAVSYIIALSGEHPGA